MRRLRIHLQFVLPNAPYVSDIMRYLTYHNSYGQHDAARELFAGVPESVKVNCYLSITGLRKRSARSACDSKLIAEAVSKLREELVGRGGVWSISTDPSSLPSTAWRLRRDKRASRHVEELRRGKR